MSWFVKEISNGHIGPAVHLQSNDNVFGRKVGTFIKLSSSYASRQHFTIRIKENCAYLIDHSTLNGTFIGQCKIPTNREIPLQNGELISVGLPVNEFSSEPYFQIFKADMDTKVYEIQDTCEATLPYELNTSVYLPPHYMNHNLNPVFDNNPFKTPISLARPSLKRLSLSTLRQSQLCPNKINNPNPPASPVNREVAPNPLASVPKVTAPISKTDVVLIEDKSDITKPSKLISSAVVSCDEPDCEIIDISDCTQGEVVENAVVKIVNDCRQTELKDHEFSLCDDIITIDSDDNEDDLPCSQFFISDPSRKEIVKIKEEHVESFKVESDSDEDVVFHDDEIGKFTYYNSFSKETDKDLDDIHQNNRELIGKESDGDNLPFLHSQLSPETYLSRADNLNNLNSINKPIELNNDLLEALMTQKELKVILNKSNNILDQQLNFHLESDEEIENFNVDTNAGCSKLSEIEVSSRTDKSKSHRSITDNREKNLRKRESNNIKKNSKTSGYTIAKDDEGSSLPSLKRKNVSRNVEEPTSKSSRYLHENNEVNSEFMSKNVNLNEHESVTKKIVNKGGVKAIKAAGMQLEERVKKLKKKTKKLKPNDMYNLRPSEKRQIVEMRKAKLKEIAQKDKEKKLISPVKEPQQIVSATSNEKCFVKNSEKTRSCVLIDMIPKKPSKNYRSKEDNVKTDGEIPGRRRSLRNNGKEMVNMSKEKSDVSKSSSDTTKKIPDRTKIISDIPKEILNKRRSHLKRSIPGEFPTETVPNEKPVSLYRRSGDDKHTALPQRRKSSLKKKDSICSRKSVQFPENPDQLTTVQFYTKDPSNKIRTNESHLKGHPISREEFIYIICKWNPKWIEESINLSSLPPLLETSFPKPSPVHNSYMNYCDYLNAFLPLQVFEMWVTMLKDISQQTQNPFVGLVRSVGMISVNPANSQQLEVVTVTTFVTSHSCSLRKNDFAIVRVIDSDCKTSRSMCLCFGVISGQPVKKPLQHSDRDTQAIYSQLRQTNDHFKDKGPSHQIFSVTFNVLVRPKRVKFWKPGQEISVFVCCNLTGDLKLFMTLEKLYSSPLASVLINPHSVQPVEPGEHPYKQQQSLNSEQMMAVNYCTSTVFRNNPSISLIHGPPGTGKSIVITHLLLTILEQARKDKQKIRLLLCAPSNYAVDQLVSRLLAIRKKLTQKKFNLVRVGKYEMMSEDAKLISLQTLSEKSLNHFSIPKNAMSEIDILLKREKYLLTLKDGASNQENIIEEIHNIRRYIRDLQAIVDLKGIQHVKYSLLKKYKYDLLINADIVATTLSSSISQPMEETFFKRGSNPFGCCIIDEASQATEVQTLIPILMNVDKFVLVGDDKQLSPVVNDQKAKADGLEVSLFQRLLRCWKHFSASSPAPVFRLLKQYRMCREISAFPCRMFYSGTLQTSDNCHRSTVLKPYLVFSHNFIQNSNHDINEDEANLVVQLVNTITRLYERSGLSIAIITPYQSQKERITKKLNQCKVTDVSVMTVDSAQGQERDVVILSSVKTNGIGFLGDPNRLNVALTRAKYAMYITANFTSLKESLVWKNLFEDSKDRKLMYELTSVPSSSVLKRYLSLS